MPADSFPEVHETRIVLPGFHSKWLKPFSRPKADDKIYVCHFSKTASSKIHITEISKTRGNSIDHEEVAQNGPPQQDLRCLKIQLFSSLAFEVFKANEP